MKTAAIISIGDEIVNGWGTDTNADYLSRLLFGLGVGVRNRYTCGDNKDDIVDALARACERADFVIVTGGLGPTKDDLTRQALADFLAVPLEFRAELLERLEEFFRCRGTARMAESNRIQTMLPAGAAAIDNPTGTAAGIRAQKNGKIIWSLPGVPAEMERMLDDTVVPEIKQILKDQRQSTIVRRLRCFGKGESSIADLLGDLMARGKNPLVNSTASAGVITLYIIARADDADTARQLADEHARTIRDRLGDVIFGTDQQTLAEVVAGLLLQKGAKLALAESCTGGLIGQMLTDCPGASGFLDYGWITYSNYAKQTELAVDAALIAEHGAVSPQVSAAMAKGARQKADADYAIAVTGIAGPGGGNEQKPVGLVYITVDCRYKSVTNKYVFPQNRQSVRMRAAMTALDMLRREISH